MKTGEMLPKSDRVIFFDTEHQAQTWVNDYWYLIGANNGDVIQTFGPMVTVRGLKVYDMADAYESGLLHDLDFVAIPEGWIVAIQYDAFDGDVTCERIRRFDEFLEMYDVGNELHQGSRAN